MHAIPKTEREYKQYIQVHLNKLECHGKVKFISLIQLIDYSWGSGLVSLLASQAHQQHGHLTSIGAFGSVGRCQILLQNEINIF